MNIFRKTIIALAAIAAIIGGTWTTTQATNPVTPSDNPAPSVLGLTYNQDCPVDTTNTWRVRSVVVETPTSWELFQDGVSIGSGDIAGGEQIVEVPRKQPSTAILKWDSDADGVLDKQTVKASGPDLSGDIEKCDPPGDGGEECKDAGEEVCEPPQTTVPPTAPPTTTVPPTTVPATTVPYDPCPDTDGVPSYPQTYGENPPCGPTEPCVGVNPATGEGTKLWSVGPCQVPVTVPPTVECYEDEPCWGCQTMGNRICGTPNPEPPASPTPTPQGSLADTGSFETVLMLALAAFLVWCGVLVVHAARRRA